jgi:hypothetical protein
MELTYNGLTSCRDIVCLTGVPNLITYTGSSTVNTKAKYTIIIERLENVDVNTTYHIHLGDYQIASVPELEMAGGSNFWMPPVDSYANRLACCNSIVRAWRNVPYIAANFNIWLEDDDDATMQPQVWIEAKKPGSIYNLAISSDFPEGNNTFTRAVDGSTNDDMLQGNDNKITCDVYRYTVQTKIGQNPDPDNREYLTTLEKNYAGKPVTFNVSPVLSTIVKDGEMEQYCFTIYGFSNGQLKFSHITEPCYITPGYQVNQSEPFIGTFTNRFFAQNVSRGDERDQFNKTYLYIYDNTLPFSLYVKNGITQTQCTVNYINSAGGTIASQQYSVWSTDNMNSLNHFSLQLDEDNFKRSNYIDLVIPDIGTVRYNVIKPINAADEREFERIEWYNEYGGISFMDFTGERTETRKEDIELYSKQNFDFYTADGRENTRVYSKKIPITIKHKTHNIDVNGKWLLFSLQNSSVAWTTINGQKYYIHIEDLEIKEATNASHIYTGTITYSFSYPDLI